MRVTRLLTLSMRKLLRNAAIGSASWWLCLSHAIAMSEFPIVMDIKQIDGKPAACLPVNDDRGPDMIQIRMVGVGRSTGPVSPVITYWGLEVPADAKPFYLKRGECLAYGQIIEGANVMTPPKPLDFNKSYDFAVIQAGKSAGPAYGAVFCVLKLPDGGVRIAVPQKVQNPCAFGN